MRGKTAAELGADIRGSKLIETICYLYERWQDEKKYEDFNDYIKYVRQDCPEVLTGTKRPFGFKFWATDGTLWVTVRAKDGNRLLVEYITIRGK